jgi:hypothetical protein
MTLGRHSDHQNLYNKIESRDVRFIAAYRPRTANNRLSRNKQRKVSSTKPIRKKEEQKQNPRKKSQLTGQSESPLPYHKETPFRMRSWYRAK